MKLAIQSRPRHDPTEWKWRFAILPTRVSDSLIVWGEWYQRRFVVIDEGNWAGGFRWRYEYRAGEYEKAWQGRARGS